MRNSYKCPSYTVNPGPVRNLRCRYKLSRSNPLICKWSEPEHHNGQIQYYKVRIAQNETILYNTTVINCLWKSKIDLKYDEVYTVTVNTVTYAVGPSITTRVIFNQSGRLDIASNQ